MKKQLLFLLTIIIFSFLFACTQFDVCGDNICSESEKESCVADCGLVGNQEKTINENSLPVGGEFPWDQEINNNQNNPESTNQNISDSDIYFPDEKSFLFVFFGRVSGVQDPHCSCDISEKENECGKYFLGDTLDYCFDTYEESGLLVSKEYKNTNEIFNSIDDVTPQIIEQINEEEKADFKEEKEISKLSFLEDVFDYNSPPSNENCLCVYNKNSSVSEEICNYYSQKRPGVSLLALDIPNSAFQSGSNVPPKEDMVKNNFDTFVKQPIYTWVESNSDKRITHLAIAKDIPTTVNGVPGEVKFGGVSGGQYLAFEGDYVVPGGNPSQSFYRKLGHFVPEETDGIRFVVSYLTGYNIDDIKKMIDKAQEPLPSFDNLKWITDRDADAYWLKVDKNVILLSKNKYLVNGKEFTLTAVEFGERPLNRPAIFKNGTVGIREESLVSQTGTIERVALPGKQYALKFKTVIGAEIKSGDTYSYDGQNYVFYYDINSFYTAYPVVTLNSPEGSPPPLPGTILTRTKGNGVTTLEVFEVKEFTEEFDYEIESTYGFSVGEGFLESTKENLLLAGVKEENIILDRENNGRTGDPLKVSGEVIAYAGPGVYHRYYGGEYWPTRKSNFDMSISNRALMNSYESFNARTFTGSATSHSAVYGATHGMIADTISPTSFGKENYENSFSGATGSVNEPYLSGISNSPIWMSAYASGMTLAESYMSGFRTLVGNVGNKGIIIGDPLMSLSNGKLASSSLCEYDLNCFRGNCDIDKFGDKRCHPIAENCVNGATSTIDFLETKNGENSCIDEHTIATCINGEWKNILTLPEGEECSLGGQKLSNGRECVQNEDCASFYQSGLPGNSCSEDLDGIKRCHTKFNCVIDSSGDEVTGHKGKCIDSSTRKICIPENDELGWFGEQECELGCESDECIYEEAIRLDFEKGKHYQFSFPLKLTEKYYEGLIADPQLGVALTVYINGEWFSVSSSILGFKHSQPITENSIFYIRSPKIFSLIGKGIKITAPQEINLKGKSSFVTFPIADSGNAEQIIKEINGQFSVCKSIYELNSETGKSDWFSLDENYSNSGEETNFAIINTGVYIIVCDKDTEAKFTPSFTECSEEKPCPKSKACVSGVCKKKSTVIISPGRIADTNLGVIVSGDRNISKSFVGIKDVIIEKNDDELVKFEHDFSEKDLNLEITDFFKGTQNNQKYVIIKGLESNSKKIFVDRGSSNFVCFLDEEISDINYLKNNCKNIYCPGVIGSVSCEIVGNKISLSGLNHSGIITDNFYCGDGQCVNDENCASCLIDCGNCLPPSPDINVECFSDSECGQSGFNGEKFCLDGNVFHMYGTSRCINPGEEISFCNISDENRLIEECGSGCANGVCILEDNICEEGGDCENGLICIDGNCVLGCANSSDCESNELCSLSVCVVINCEGGFAASNHACSCEGMICNEKCYLESGICCNEEWFENQEACINTFEFPTGFSLIAGVVILLLIISILIVIVSSLSFRKTELKTKQKVTFKKQPPLAPLDPIKIKTSFDNVKNQRKSSTDQERISKEKKIEKLMQELKERINNK